MPMNGTWPPLPFLARSWPITTTCAYVRCLFELSTRVRLVKVTGQPMTYSVERQGPGATMKIISPPCPIGVHPLVHRARTLGWAYLGGQPKQMVIPYCVDTTSHK